MSVTAPCKGCEDRYVGCHSTCGKYLEYRNVITKEKELVNSKKSVVSEAYGFKRDQIEKYLRKQGRG